MYLEVIGPDPEQPEPLQPRWFGIDELISPRLVTWAVRSKHLDAIVATAAAHGCDLAPVSAGHRRLRNGSLLEWRLTSPAADRAGGVIPFFIDWGQSLHPSTSAPAGIALVGLRAEHQEAARVRSILDVLDVALDVRSGPGPGLVATIATSTGQVLLR
jgi:hypothetical protein